jgi:DsbC/DsbD-like thiol-disulfide interchange protein
MGLSITHAQAQDASPWLKEPHTSARLLAGSRSGTLMLGGIELQLDPGWKTYWRNAGDSGVPPRIDFSKSENVDAVTILWPAPSQFEDGSGGVSFGYKNHVVLPLRIVAKDSDRPVILRADISYAVCEKLCIPVDATLTLPFTSVASTEDNTLTNALDTVPKPAIVGDKNLLTIRDVKRDGPKAVVVDVAAPVGTSVELFAEGPTPDWALPVPKLVKREADGVQRFAFDLDGLPSGAKAYGAALKLTLVAKNETRNAAHNDMKDASKDASFEFNVNLN